MGEPNKYVEKRPFSDNLVDLHVSVVPMKHWVEKLNYASHKVIGDTFSAGFIRVLPETSVAMLRNEIIDQLGNEIFPQDYVFLKHVGRCLALVRQSQEKQLKVKNFLPPHSLMPEIFVLPGQPAMYTYKVLPPIQPRLQDLHISSSDRNPTNFQSIDSSKRSLLTKSPYKYKDVDMGSGRLANSPEIEKSHVKRSYDAFQPDSQSGDYELLAHSATDHPVKTRLPSSVQRQELKRQQRHVSGKSNYENEAVHTHSYEPQKYADGYNGENADDDDRSPLNLSQSLVEERRPSLAKSVLREGPKKRRVRYTMPPQSNGSSQDVDLNADAINHPLHALHHSERHRHRTSSASDSSFESNLPDETGPNQFEVTHHSNYDKTSRMRKQFIDTSAHLFANPNGRNMASNSTRNSYLANGGSDLPHSSLPVPRSPVPPLPMHSEPHRSHVNVLRSNSRSESYHSEEPHEESGFDPRTDPQWVASNTREQVKSSSGNNDSGYVEHEMSETDEDFFKTNDGRPASADHEEVNEDSMERDKVGVDVTASGDGTSRVGEHVRTVHAEVGVRIGTDLHQPNNSRNFSMSLSRNGDGQANFSSSNSRQNSPSDFQEPSSLPRGNSDPRAKEVTLRHKETLLSHHNFSGADDSQKNRVLSQDSSYQYDFYDRPGPRPPTDQGSAFSDKVRATPSSSPAPADGSKLLYRLSSNGYRIKSSRAPSGENANPSKSDGFSSQQNDADSENEGYESSEDEFQQELANITNRNADVRLVIESAEEQAFQSGTVTAPAEEGFPVPESAPSENAPFRSKTLEGQELPQRISISGSSVRSEKFHLASSTVTAVFSASTIAPANAEQLPYLSDGAVKKLLDGDTHLKSDQSRGAPDGMPTQKKVNTGGSDKPDEIVPCIVSGPQPRLQGASSGEIVKISASNNDVSEIEVPSSLIRGSVDEVPRKSTTDLALSVQASSTFNHPEVLKTDSISTPIQIPQFKKPDVEKEEVAEPKTPAPVQVEEKPKPASPKPETETVEEVSNEVAVISNAKRLGSPARARLWEELQKVRTERRKAEKQRQDLVQHAKVVTSKMNQKRSSATFSKVYSGSCKWQRRGKVYRQECLLPGCCYFCSTDADYQRHYMLVHKGKAKSDKNEQCMLSWKRKILSNGVSKLAEKPPVKVRFQDESQCGIGTRSGRRKKLCPAGVAIVPLLSAATDFDRKSRDKVRESPDFNVHDFHVRDMWKKKFFEEKKKTLPLEDICRRLQNELDNSHRRLMTAMESKKQSRLNKLPPILPTTSSVPSTKNNTRIQAARLQHDMDNLRRKIEDAKIKLTGEIKLRHQAEQDVKSVRQEVLAKKIRAHIALREMNKTRRFPLKA